MRKRNKVLAASVALLATVGVVVAQGNAPARGPMMGGGMMGGPGMGMMAAMAIASEADFLADMIPHHEEAITSARALLEGTKRPEMRQLARNIIAAQTREVKEMRAWLARWYPQTQESADYQPMMSDYSGLSGAEIDRLFLAEMPMHHMMAVMMARQVLFGNLAQHQQVRQLANDIITSQTSEIRQMRTWAAQWFGANGMMAGNGMMGGGMMGSGGMMGGTAQSQNRNGTQGMMGGNAQGMMPGMMGSGVQNGRAQGNAQPGGFDCPMFGNGGNQSAPIAPRRAPRR